MKQEVFIKNVGNITLTDKNYVGSGGEATIYKHQNMAIKLYHDHKKSIPEAKINELSIISATNVCKPLHTVYDSKNRLIGYCMSFIKDTQPICKLFTKSFRDSNSISHADIIDIVKFIQKTIGIIHDDQCLIVDLNEMNLLVSSDFETPIFIDVDSYQTKSFRATAIMDSIRDRTVKNNNWTELSDWYSFAILAFQLYIGIHPYKGKHPKYKANEWIKRMDDNISVFDKDTSLPAICNDFTVIPSRHLDWLKKMNWL